MTLVGRSNLTHHQDARIAKSLYHAGNQIPESDDWNSKFYAHTKLPFEQLAVSCGGYEIYPEWLRRKAANSLDLLAYQAGRLPNHAEESETARLGYCRDEFRSGNTTHSGQHDWMLAPE
jgi:hypothetical protein